MQARDDGRAGAIVIDKREVPQRMLAIERRADHLTRQLLQRRFIAGRGQRDAPHVIVQIEVRIDLPRGQAEAQPRLAHALLKPIVDQQALGHHRAKALVVQRRVKHHHAHNHG